MTNNMSPNCNARPSAIALNFKNRIVMRIHYRHSLFRRLVTGVIMVGVALNATANPTGMTVQGGSATAASSGLQLTVTTTSQNTVLNWQSFNIGPGETTTFQEPSTTSIVWNQINNNANPSQIYGNLQANGIVVLLNSSGFYFGPNSFVSAAGLVVSTANCVPPQNGGGGWEFNGPPPLASIVNYGQIKIGHGGSAFLIADQIENFGDIEAPGGSVGLAAGQTVLLSERPDGRGMSMAVTLPSGSVDNEGKLIADGGTIAMHAQVVNQNGFIQANSVENVNGTIELVASDQLTLGANSQISASGDNSPAGSAGGTVTIQSGNNFSDSVGSQITVTGGAQGGNGGNVEISAPNILSLNSSVNAGAQTGWDDGLFVLDPMNINLGNSGTTSGGTSGTINGSGSGNGTLNVNVNTAFQNITAGQILLEASGNITLLADTIWDLYASTGDKTSGNLTLEAAKNITFQDGSSIVDANGWSVTLDAGYNFTTKTVVSTVGTSSSSTAGNIFLNGGNNGTGSGSIQTASGAITLEAGNGIQLGSGSVSSSAGDVKWQASGDIVFGDGSQITDGSGAVTLNAGYSFVNSAVKSGSGNIYLDGGLAGDGIGGSIQTASGDITLAAGQDITVGAGYVITTGGGSIYAHALAGDIDTGTDPEGYHFESGASSLSAAYDLSGGLGGISTAAGGDVTLIAGGDVTSFLPGAQSPNNADYTTAGSGAYGSQPGNVTIVAGGSVTGHYLVANGAGRIYAGVQMDANGNPIIKTDSLGSPVNAVDGRGNTILLAANTGAVIGRDAQGNPILLDGSGNVIPTTSVTVVPNGTTTDANGDKVNAYIIKFIPAGGGPEQDENAYAMDAYALNPGSSSSAGTDQLNPNLALSLVNGGWNVTAAQNIILQEVRNPNGVFDINGGGTYNHYFNYGPGDYVNLTADNLVQLGASPSILPRPTGIPVPFIYPPILNVTAGAGGVELIGRSTDPFNQLILFPSPQGSLTINTTDGGSLFSGLASSGGVPQIFSLIVSDASSSEQLTTSSSDGSCSFGIGDHADSPVHLNNSTPITLNISGDMSQVLLAAPEAAQINVVGNMYNSRFQGMNLSANDVTSINVGLTAEKNMENSGLLDPNTDSGIKVGGDIINRGAFTSVTLDLTQTGFQAPDMTDLSLAVNNSISAATLITSLYYNPSTGVLTYQNINGMNIASVLNLLQNLTVQQVDAKGNLLWLDPAHTIPSTKTVSILGDPTVPGTAAYALLAQYNAENEASHIPDGSGPPDGTYGYTIGGGGQFDITARTIDLGTTAGIQSAGVGLYMVNGNYPLASLFGSGGVFKHGADITITTIIPAGDQGGTTAAGEPYGNLDMYSSSIASLQGGDITIYAGGDINAGSADFSVNTSSARGIYSTDQGNVFVYANGDINVNGSRIAVYDTRQHNGSATRHHNSSVTPGGSVTVVSRNGNIDAGNGGSGFVVVTSYLVNPDGSVTALSPTIPGSGIMEVSYTKNGNILVEAPNGTVNASAGGILQLLLNGPALPESTTLFSLPLNSLGKLFDLALSGNMNAALALQSSLNGNPGNSAVDVFAGYELQQLDGSGNPIVDAYGDPLITALNLSDGTLVKISDNRDISATGSGVLGAGSVTLTASGNVAGTVFTLGNININAVNNINVSALGLGNVNVDSAGGTVSGTIIGVGGVSASGSSIDANLESNGSVSGNTSGQSGLAPGTAADATSQGMASDNSASPAKNADTTVNDDDEKKKKGKVAATVQKSGRVTVLLPPRHLSQ